MFFATRASGIPFDLRSRYVGDIFQYPEISGNGRGSGHAWLRRTYLGLPEMARSAS